jgi:hypothetical protein
MAFAETRFKGLAKINPYTAYQTGFARKAAERAAIFARGV